jgi:hypothetical protein
LQTWEEMMVGYYTTMPAEERVAQRQAADAIAKDE